MGTADEWRELGRVVKERRMARSGSRRALAGRQEATFRRIENGLPISVDLLYVVLARIEMEQEEAASWFGRLELPFEVAVYLYHRPDAIQRLEDALRAIRKGTEDAKIALAQLEAERRAP